MPRILFQKSFFDKGVYFFKCLFIIFPSATENYRVFFASSQQFFPIEDFSLFLKSFDGWHISQLRRIPSCRTQRYITDRVRNNRFTAMNIRIKNTNCFFILIQQYS